MITAAKKRQVKFGVYQKQKLIPNSRSWGGSRAAELYSATMRYQLESHAGLRHKTEETGESSEERMKEIQKI